MLIEKHRIAAKGGFVHLTSCDRARQSQVVAVYQAKQRGNRSLVDGDALKIAHCGMF
ncbi:MULTISPECIES: hypothetical protein [unclassified Bradyrhizobium]|uniref:hypothetical protein n=1 Tax=unclassified Bradyrhizobium TaxID=2631580 RepID=UPI0028E5BC9F|nr:MULTISPECIES: hypothetical protein [unclassified Bradyrhizobium]